MQVGYRGYAGEVARNRYVRAVGGLAASNVIANAPRHLYNAYQAVSPYARAAYNTVSNYYNRPPAKIVVAHRPRRRRRYAPKKSLKSQVKQLTKQVNALDSLHIYRNRSAYEALCSVNQSTHTGSQIGSITDFETGLTDLRYYDPANPGTLVTAAGGTGTFTRDFRMNMYGSLRVKNNYQVPVKITMYLCRVKNDTSLTALTCFTDGLTDSGAPSSTSTLVYLSDSELFKDLYKIEKTKSKLLKPGNHMFLAGNTGWVDYSPSISDSHNLDFQKSLKSFAILIRIEGDIAHDSSADQQGLAAGGVDVVKDVTIKTKYNSGGASLKTIVVSSTGLSSFTNGAVQSQVVVDNQAYSVA